MEDALRLRAMKIAIPTTIAIIGAGNVGSALATRWLAKGHEVVLGVREPESPKSRALVGRLGARARAASIADAARDAQVLVLATPWPATKAAVEQCGDVRGKLVIDCTNPLAADLSGLTIGHTRSAAEEVASFAKGAAVFKSFNTTGANNMESQAGYPQKPVMFFCGDDAKRRDAVKQLVLDAGFDAVDAGPLRAARWLEPLAMLWIHLAFNGGLGRDFAFALMKRNA